MAKYCKLTPDKGAKLFTDLKKEYGRETAKKLWSLCMAEGYLANRHFSLDSEGFPSMDDLVADRLAQQVMGEENELKTLRKKFPQLTDTRENYARLVRDAYAYNSDVTNRKYVAIVKADGKGNLSVSMERRNRVNEGLANDQYATQTLNESLATVLAPVGITIGDITEAERQAGRIGVTDFTKAKSLASDSAHIIRVANNHEGHRALGEEVSHLIIGTFRDEPIVKRALEALQDKDVLQAVLGDEFEATEDFQDADLALMAEEALGKLLRENLLAEAAA